MTDTNALLAALASCNVTLGARRPDGGRVISLHDDNGDLLIQRVISRSQLGHPEGLAEVLDSVRRDLLVVGGRASEEARVALRTSDRVRAYA